MAIKRTAILIIIGILLFIAFAYTDISGEQTGQAEEKTDLPKDVTGEDGAPMILIPAGEFQMGSSNGESDEKPVHTVYLDAFYMDKYEVTNAQYRRFVQATGYRQPEGFSPMDAEKGFAFKPWQDENFRGDDQPVILVSWEDAKAYCDWAGKRLPTEAEWEKAARGGLAGRKYTWGDDWPPPGKAGNFADETAGKVFPGQYWGNVKAFPPRSYDHIKGYDDGYTYPAPVGSFKPNGCGLYDMAGNVWEWCADWYDEDYYGNSPGRSPSGPGSGETRVVRGSSWYNSDADSIRVSYRLNRDPTNAWIFLGFRCARDAR